MPRTQIPITYVTHNGAEFNPDVTIDNTNGMYFLNSGKEILAVKNTHATNPLTVTLTYATDELGRGGTKQVTVPATKTYTIGLFNKELYNQDLSGTVNVDFSANTGTVRVYSHS